MEAFPFVRPRLEFCDVDVYLLQSLLCSVYAVSKLVSLSLGFELFTSRLELCKLLICLMLVI